MKKKNKMMTNARLPKFASLLSDAGFKAVLAEPRNRTVLKKLLNLVLPQDRQISEIESYGDREVNGFTPFGKYSRVDIRVKDTYGREFIVEMQREMHECFFQRCMWYGSNAYGHELPVGAEYEDLKPVYVIAFLEDELIHKNENLQNSEGCISYYQMTEKATGEFAPETIICIFVELGKFVKSLNELSGSLDKACYVFKNSEKWNTGCIPKEILEDEVARELTRACEVENFPAEIKLNYLKTMFTEMDYKAEMKANFKKGAIQNARENAIKMRTVGIPVETIAFCTGLSIDDVKNLA